MIKLFLFSLFFQFIFSFHIGIYLYRDDTIPSQITFPEVLNFSRELNTSFTISKYLLNSKNLCEIRNDLRNSVDDNERLLNIFLSRFSGVECLDLILDDYKSIGVLTSPGYLKECRRNIFYTSNSTILFSRGIFIYFLVMGYMRFYSKPPYLIVFPSDRYYDYDKIFIEVFSLYTNDFTIIYSSYSSFLNLNDMKESNNTIISFLPTYSYVDIANINIPVYFLFNCISQELNIYYNKNLYCFSPSINTDNVYSVNITKYIEEKYPEYLYNFVHELVFTYIIKIYEISKTFSNCSNFQFKYQLLNKIYDNPFPILHQSIKTDFVAYNNDGSNILLSTKFAYGKNYFYYTDSVKNIECRLIEKELTMFPVVLLFFKESLVREGVIMAFRKLNYDIFDDMYIFPYFINLDDYTNSVTLLTDLRDLYNKIDFRIVIISGDYHDYSFIYQNFTNDDVLFLSLSGSLQDVYYENVIYSIKSIDAAIYSDYSFSKKAIIIGDFSLYSDYYYYHLQQYFLSKNICSHDFKYDLSDMSIFNIVNSIITYYSEESIIYCTFTEENSLLLLDEINKRNENELKYHVIFTVFSEMIGKSHNLTGHYIFTSFLSDDIYNFPYINGEYDKISFNMLSLPYINEEMFGAYYSVLYILMPIHYIGLLNDVIHLKSSLKTFQFSISSGKLYYTHDNNIISKYYWLYYTSSNEVIKIEQNGVVNMFYPLNYYDNYFNNLEYNTDFEYVVFILPIPEYNYIFEMLRIITIGYNNKRVINHDNYNYLRAISINSKLSSQEILNELNNIYNQKNIAFILTSEEYFY